MGATEVSIRGKRQETWRWNQEQRLAKELSRARECGIFGVKSLAHLTYYGESTVRSAIEGRRTFHGTTPLGHNLRIGSIGLDGLRRREVVLHGTVTCFGTTQVFGPSAAYVNSDSPTTHAGSLSPATATCRLHR